MENKCNILVVDDMVGPREALRMILKNKHEVGFDIRLTLLGHIQRGGSPTAFDRLLATRMGVRALEVLRDGQSGVMVNLEGRETGTIAIEKAIAKTREINPSYFDLARILAR